jgi:hypothetical protein
MPGAIAKVSKFIVGGLIQDRHIGHVSQMSYQPFLY